jgi:catechol 2,3-dioxygenase-like lactoylglutathione lyase family enzyme
MTTTIAQKSNVGGVLLDRPFKIRRLGHFGLNMNDVEAARHFYVDLLGFRISDARDRGEQITDPAVRASLGNTWGYFTRYGSDHHAFVFGNKRLAELMGRVQRKPDITIGQITWQVQSLAEAMQASEWFREQGLKLNRVGRDMPGSNWHTYLNDPDGHNNELYYGIEQIGWEGFSKPQAMYNRRFTEKAELPQISEFEEVQQALADGVDLHAGYRHIELPGKYDVDGVLLPRPFKIVKLGPVSIFVEDLERAAAFYVDAMGFIPTEEVVWQGERCLFLRCNTEHHALALLPMALREKLGLSGHTTLATLGLQLANYRQLRDAVSFLRENGVRVETDIVPQALRPGIDYAAYAFDPDGHCVELYFAMEQIGWDGRPRPQHLRPWVDPHNWPDVLEPASDTFMGETFLGPWG